MERKDRYFHMSEPEVRIVQGVASLSRWCAILLGISGVLGVALYAIAFGSAMILSSTIVGAFLGNPEPDMTFYYLLAVLGMLVPMVFILLPTVLLFKFGRSLNNELASGREVMSIAKPLSKLRALLIILLIEGILLMLVVLGPLTTLLSLMAD